MFAVALSLLLSCGGFSVLVHLLQVFKNVLPTQKTSKDSTTQVCLLSSVVSFVLSHTDTPNVSLRACNFKYIAIQWNKPASYGDALVTGYKVFVNGVVEAVLNADQLSYTYSQGKWCREYIFQVQVGAVEQDAMKM